MKRSEKKRKQKKVVLMFTLATAAVIVGGMTFAWFSSKDQVTNRLSATANYGTAIVEDFQSPEDWIPGQEINKDVSVVNTGSVDALVRMYFDGQMKVLKEATPSVDATTAVSIVETNKVTDEKLKALGLTYSNGSGLYYKELSQDKIENDLDKNSTPAVETDADVAKENVPGRFSEVQSVQAGGILVYAPEKAAYTWELEQATTLPVYSGATSTDTNLAKGTTVGTGNSSATSKITAADTNYYGVVDASTFKPETTGLYIFRRNVKDVASDADTYEYSGYYYDKTANKYFALHYGTGANGKSDYVLPKDVINDNATAAPSKDQVLPVTIADGQKVYLYTAQESVINTGSTDNDLNWAYDSTNKKFVVTYKNTDTANTTDDIVVDVKLNGGNIGEGKEKWTAVPSTGNDHTTTFYYNNDVESGDTTTKLVDSVVLSENTKAGAYLAFDFDLNVYMDSVQVTKDQDGKETINAAKATWNTATDGKTTAITDSSKVKTYSGSEIEEITWTATSGS